MSEPVQIQNLISRVLQGQIRVPGFQRSFVWDPDRAALLMDSIYKGYPFGSILLWRTKSVLKTEKSLGGFELPAPAQDYPIDYVLDGQQRITSIFATFQTELAEQAEDPAVWLPIYYDFEAQTDAQDSKFVALAKDAVDPNRHFALRSFFDPVGFSRAQRALDDDAKLEEIVKVQSRFSGTLIPVETFAEEDRASVAIVFERVNRLGIKLDTFQLLTAWTWSEEFDLQAKFEELSERFDEFGFHEVGEDNDLMLRCAATVLRGDPSPTALIDVNGGEVRSAFDTVGKALEGAIDFLRSNLHVRHLRFLPYSALLIPLTAYFSKKQGQSVPSADRDALLRWFWRTSFTHRYSGNPSRNVKSDVAEALKLRGGEPSELDNVPTTMDGHFYSDRAFNTGTVATKAFLLQLAGHHPRSFMSGSPVDLDKVLSEPNRREYHHCFPKAYLVNNEVDLGGYRLDCLANFAFLNRAENREISDKAPSGYKALMGSPLPLILQSQVLPDALFTDNWHEFITDRSAELILDAEDLMNTGLPDGDVVQLTY